MVVNNLLVVGLPKVQWLPHHNSSPSPGAFVEVSCRLLEAWSTSHMFPNQPCCEVAAVRRGERVAARVGTSQLHYLGPAR